MTYEEWMTEEMRHPVCGDCIIVWPDNTLCFHSELDEMLAAPCAKSDDYEIVLCEDSKRSRYQQLLEVM